MICWLCVFPSCCDVFLHGCVVQLTPECLATQHWSGSDRLLRGWAPPHGMRLFRSPTPHVGLRWSVLSSPSLELLFLLLSCQRLGSPVEGIPQGTGKKNRVNAPPSLCKTLAGSAVLSPVLGPISLFRCPANHNRNNYYTGWVFKGSIPLRGRSMYTRHMGLWL